MPALRAIGGAVAARPWIWLGVAVGFLVLYHLAQLGAMLVRFGMPPNYIHWYDVATHFGNIIAGTPDWTDRIALMLDEPLFETGYRNPEYYNIAEWSFLLLPGNLLLMTAVGVLLATFVCMRLQAGRCAARARGDGTLAGVGAVMAGLAASTLTWVVCCGTPSWVVILAVLGVGTSTALAMQPLGPLMAVAGMVLLAAALLYQARRIVGVPVGAAAPDKE